MIYLTLQRFSSIIFAFVWKHENTKPHVSHITNMPVQTRATSTGWFEEVWQRFWGPRQGSMKWDQQKGEGWENKEGEDKQGKQLGSLVQCGEVGSWGHRRKGRPFMGRGTMRLKWYISRLQTLISQEEIYGYVMWGTLCLHTLIQRWKWVWTTSNPPQYTFPDTEWNPQR